MVNRIIFCFVLVTIGACSTAKMAFDPGLEVDSEKFQITERPKFFSGGDLVFGPYKATKISRSFINGSGTFISTPKISFGNRKQGQDYSYHFKGKNSWNGDCKVKSGHSEFGIVSAGYYSDIDCTFIPADGGNTSASAWNFSIRGQTSGTAKGSINIGSKTIRIAAIDKIEGSNLKMGRHTGYYFYSGQRIIAGVDAISNEGPVWLNKKLSQHEKDAIGLVVVALLLNQT